MKAGDEAVVKGTILRVDGERVDLQTENGQLIQTKVSNVTAIEKPSEKKSNGKNEGRKGPVGYATRG